MVTFLNNKKIDEIIYSSPKLDRVKSGEITGYASIDKPWEKFYENNSEIIIPRKNLYRVLIENNSDNLDNVAFVCADRGEEKVTYREFINEIDNVSKGLVALGLKEGDEIIVTYKNSLEGNALVFAKSRLGIVTHFIDPSNSLVEKKRMISETNASYYFVSEEFVDGIDNLVDECQLKGAIVLPSLEKSSVSCCFDGCISYDDFKNGGTDVVLSDISEKFDSKDCVSSIMYTGGSTGTSKGVMLNDYNFVSKYYRQINSNWKWGRNRINLGCLPGIIAFGLSDGIISPLLAGETTVIVDCLAILRFPEFILKYKPNDVSCSPIHIEQLVNSPLIDATTDLSYLEMMPCGGDGMTKKADLIARDFLSAHGAKDAFAQGCGFTESTGAFCYGLGAENEPGYMGIPLNGNISAVFDPATGEELKYGEVGEWAVLTDTAMTGYFGSAEKVNKNSLKVHDDGNVWLHPGDMVHMDENGRIAMNDRTSRTFNYMGMKVYPSALESFLSTHPAIKKCIISGVKSPFSPSVAVTDQKVPIVNIALNDEYKGKEEDVVSDLEEIISNNAQTYISILAYIFRDNLPYTNRGKINYQQLISDGCTEAEDRKVFVKKFSV